MVERARGAIGAWFHTNGWRDLWLLIVTALLFVGALRVEATVNRVDETVGAIHSEGAERRDQVCTRDEREHQRAVEGLKLTYDFLVSLTPQERRGGINGLLLRELPRTEERARLSAAPEFCDEPNVGLDEPNPEIPKRPAELR